MTVLTPAYNAEKTIGETIQSVLNQTYTNWEMIIIDDASTDKTLEIIQRFHDERIKLIQNSKNSGPAMSWNRGFEVMRGRFLAFLDADDLWEPDKLNTQIAYMLSNNYEYTFTSYDWISEAGESLGKIVKAEETWTYKDQLKNPIIGNSTVIFDRRTIPIHMLPDIRLNQDGLLRGPIEKAGHVAHGIPEVYTHYRISENGYSRNKLIAAKRLWTIYRDILHIPFFHRCYYFYWYAINSIKKYYL